MSAINIWALPVKERPYRSQRATVTYLFNQLTEKKRYRKRLEGSRLDSEALIVEMGLSIWNLKNLLTSLCPCYEVHRSRSSLYMLAGDRHTLGDIEKNAVRATRCSMCRKLFKVGEPNPWLTGSMGMWSPVDSCRIRKSKYNAIRKKEGRV